MNQSRKILSPFGIGGKQVKNRIVFGPHRTNYAENHVPGEQHVQYYGRRAKGGAGIIVVEGAIVHSSDYPYEKAIFGFKDDVISAYQRIVETVREYDSILLAQLNHFGGQADSSLSRSEIWAPSAVPEVNSGEISKVMEKEEIQKVVNGFAAATLRMKKAGMDGVEITAGQFSLLRQFLSPLTNFRTDEYGGDIKNRARLTREVLENVRYAAGPEFIVGLRLCGDEFAPWGGLTTEDCKEIAKYLCEDGLVDYLTVEVGGPYSVHMTQASMRYPENYAVSAAQAISEAVQVPVCATGSIVSVKEAETVLDGGIELVEMTRALIADPFFVEKLASDHSDDIRPCILCNQDCYIYSGMNPTLKCAVNPEVGKESAIEHSTTTSGKLKRVVVIGGGPGGLQAAVTASEKGHSVTLFERKKELGGRVRLLSKIEGCQRYWQIIEYLEHCARRSGVEIKLECRADEKMIVESSPDVVIVSEGRKLPPIPFVIEDDVDIKWPEAILGGQDTGETVLIVDLEGSWQAVGVGLALSERGRKIKIVTPDLFVSSQLSKNGEFINWYQQAFQKNIEFIPQTQVTRVKGTKVDLLDKYSREGWSLSGIDTVVPAIPGYPNYRLFESLVGKGFEILAVGDCVAPRNTTAAIWEGYQAGSMI